MNDLQALMEADAEVVDATPDQLSLITTSAYELRAQNKKLEGLEQQVKETQAEIRRLREQVLPGLMDTAGVTSLTLDFGDTIVRGEEVYASISKANSSAAFTWMESHGYGALIKSEIAIPLSKGDSKGFQKITALLKKAKIGFIQESSIHGQTLKKFVREALEAGKKLPKSITHHTVQIAELKGSKKK